MLEQLQESLHYEFKNIEYLKNALIHKSFHEGLKKGLPDNEKLEFLGDSVINLVITDYLFKNFKHMNEGELSKLKAHLVSTNSLAVVARSLNLSEFALMGKGEEKNDGRKNKKINASLLEAVVGAIYVDSNFKTASFVVMTFFKEFLEHFSQKEAKINDYKSELQELMQKKDNHLPEYKIIKETGKPPEVIFTAVVYIDKKEIGTGTGSNKRKAEQDAAFNALKKIDEFFNYEKLSEVFFLRND